MNEIKLTVAEDSDIILTTDKEVNSISIGGLSDIVTVDDEAKLQQYYNNGYIEGTADGTEAGTEAMMNIFTDNKTRMACLFYGCSLLKQPPYFDTSKVISFYQAFYNCTDLIDLPVYNTSNVTNFNYSFYRCGNLKKLPQFNFNKATNVQGMCNYCTMLEEVQILNTNSVTQFGYMFGNCYKLKTIKSINVEKATSGLDTMFMSCKALENISFNGVIKLSGLKLSISPLLTHTSLINIINALYDYSSGATHNITLGSTNLAKLTNAEKAIATNKNWTLA